MMENILQKSSSVSGVALEKGSNSNKLSLCSTNGTGDMIFYTLFPGIHLAFIHVDSLIWPESDSNTQLRPLLINYCVNGRSELMLEDNNYIYVKEKDISISNQAAQKKYIFPTKHYEGIKIYFETDLLSTETRKTLELFGINVEQLEKMYCANGKTYIAAVQEKTEYLLNQIWNLFSAPSLFHMQLFTLELLHTLLQEEVRPFSPCVFHTGVQVEIAKKAEQLLTADIRRHYPIKKLAEQFSVSETSLKNYFRGVYGKNISSYLRTIRMNNAAKLLKETQLPISEVSVQIGYTNQGKFAAIFKKQFGLTPLEYRRSKHLERF